MNNHLTKTGSVYCMGGSRDDVYHGLWFVGYQLTCWVGAPCTPDVLPFCTTWEWSTVHGSCTTWEWSAVHRSHHLWISWECSVVHSTHTQQLGMVVSARPIPPVHQLGRRHRASWNRNMKSQLERVDEKPGGKDMGGEEVRTGHIAGAGTTFPFYILSRPGNMKGLLSTRSEIWKGPFEFTVRGNSAMPLLDAGEFFTQYAFVIESHSTVLLWLGYHSVLRYFVVFWVYSPVSMTFTYQVLYFCIALFTANTLLRENTKGIHLVLLPRADVIREKLGRVVMVLVWL